ncbi:MAG: 16S rRNA (guanine(966)-N(2))-methyltransferase RsmD [Coriobacteriales bacterium]|nr:16S rRNA (guanine(966)-N(2))-methyltransferase RsmD [Coriobacteriales bacterium]
MRIVAGSFRGRRLEAPKGRDTRPTTDRVREALFSTLTSLLGPALGDASVLDAFAGSGALGLEAISRGARSATFIERDRAALAALRANIESLALSERTQVVAGDALASRRIERLPGRPFSLLLLDPPYRIDPTAVRGYLTALADLGALDEDAVVTWEHATGERPPWPDGFVPVTTKRYGSTEIDVARWERGSEAS